MKNIFEEKSKINESEKKEIILEKKNEIKKSIKIKERKNKIIFYIIFLIQIALSIAILKILNFKINVLHYISFSIIFSLIARFIIAPYFYYQKNKIETYQEKNLEKFIDQIFYVIKRIHSESYPFIDKSIKEKDLSQEDKLFKSFEEFIYILQNKIINLIFENNELFEDFLKLFEDFDKEIQQKKDEIKKEKEKNKIREDKTNEIIEDKRNEIIEDKTNKILYEINDFYHCLNESMKNLIKNKISEKTREKENIDEKEKKDICNSIGFEIKEIQEIIKKDFSQEIQEDKLKELYI